VAVFICNEENGEVTDISIDRLLKEGYLDALKAGPVFWVDSADIHPCIGTLGSITWELLITGKLFHSGFPHLAINSVEMACDTVDYIQTRFYKDFPKLPQDDEYKFATGSTMKPTQMNTPPGSLNQIPGSCTVKGDIRLSPFYDIADLRVKIEEYVRDINESPSILEDFGTHGPYSRYHLPDEDYHGNVKLTWLTEGGNGIACTLHSLGHKALWKATNEYLGAAENYSITGSLPLVRDLQEAGFDLQICGYGISSKYHAENEHASLESFRKATKIMFRVSIHFYLWPAAYLHSVWG
jgi:acetylornithine deacetylase